MDISKRLAPIQTNTEVTYLSLRDDESLRHELIVTTPGHPFYLEKNVDNSDRPAPKGHEDLSEPWVGAGDLKLGDKVRQADGTAGTVRIVKTTQQERTMYNLDVANLDNFYVGEQGWLVHNCSSARAVVYTINGVQRSYVSYFDVQLPPSLWVSKRGKHFAEANKALYNELTGNPALKDWYEKNYPGVYDFVKPNASGGFEPSSPTTLGFTWHHSVAVQANGQQGVMQLVKNSDHVSGSSYYHPGSSGGCKEWGGGCR